MKFRPVLTASLAAAITLNAAAPAFAEQDNYNGYDAINRSESRRYAFQDMARSVEEQNRRSETEGACGFDCVLWLGVLGLTAAYAYSNQQSNSGTAAQADGESRQSQYWLKTNVHPYYQQMFSGPSTSSVPSARLHQGYGPITLTGDCRQDPGGSGGICPVSVPGHYRPITGWMAGNVLE